MEKGKKGNRNIGLKVLSVLIAILIWWLVANINDPVKTERFSGIPVEIINEDVLTDLGYAYEVVEGDTVTITVEGKTSVVDNLSASDFEAVADFSKLSEVDAVPIDVSVKKYSSQLELSLGNVNTMIIKKDAVVSVSVPVNVVLNGETAGGYAVGSTSGRPNLVKVTGPENLLSGAKEVRAEVNISGIAEDMTTTVEPVLYDAEGNEISSTQIDMDTQQIEVSVNVWKTKLVNVELEADGSPAEGFGVAAFDYEPKTMTVAAPDDILDDLFTITLPAFSLSGLSDDYEMDIELTEDLLPDSVVWADDVNDIKAKVTIEPISSRNLTFSKSAIRVKGKKNRTVNFDRSNQYSISIEGCESIVKGVSVSDFDPWVEVGDLDEGEHTVRLHVKEVEGVSVTDAPTVMLTIEE